MAAVLLPRRARRNLLAVAGLVVAATCVAIADMRVGGPGANVVQELVLKYGGHLAVRAELWQRGLLILHDFPLTGIGINTLPLVLPVMYPLIISSGDPRPPPHVHNFLLQTGVDLGVPGVLALIWILGVTSRLLWGGWKAQQGSARLLALSLGAGLIAHLIFGLTDAVALGARPGFLLWWTFGLAEAVWVTRSSSR
jgi:putative inorganic carbon (HCO3(-)) transporter